VCVSPREPGTVLSFVYSLCHHGAVSVPPPNVTARQRVPRNFIALVFPSLRGLHQLLHTTPQVKHPPPYLHGRPFCPQVRPPLDNNDFDANFLRGRRVSPSPTAHGAPLHFFPEFFNSTLYS